jgi:hypothetical protein
MAPEFQNLRLRLKISRYYKFIGPIVGVLYKLDYICYIWVTFFGKFVWRDWSCKNEFSTADLMRLDHQWNTDMREKLNTSDITRRLPNKLCKHAGLERKETQNSKAGTGMQTDVMKRS